MLPERVDRRGSESGRVSGEYDPRITAYFGDAVLRAGFMPVPHLFMRHYRALGLNAAQAMFVLQVMESAWDLAEAPRTVGDLARRMGVDKRTIRKYSEEVEALGLITLYDQFDTNGAQVENGYDLTLLFQRLAQLAPEAGTGGTLRRRQARRETAHAAQAITPVEHSVRPTPGTNDPSPRNERSVPVDQAIHAGVDQTISAPRNERSALKRNSRIRKNQDACMMHAATEQIGQVRGSGLNESAGVSLRRQTPLTAADVHVSDCLLQRMGVENPLRGWIAQCLAPAEAWALRVYGAAKGWRAGLIVSQVYDKQRKQPQPASVLTAQYDAVGQQLADLDPALAEHALHEILAHCPHAPDQLRAAVQLDAQSEQFRAAAMAAWQMVAELRGQPGAPLTPRNSVPTVAASAGGHDPLCSVWTPALGVLERSVPVLEFEAWLKPTKLLLLEGDQAVIGVPNVFARDRLQLDYVEQVRAALQTVVGQTVQVQFVIA